MVLGLSESSGAPLLRADDCRRSILRAAKLLKRSLLTIQPFQLGVYLKGERVLRLSLMPSW
jgi:hypothetical protein